MTDWLLDTILVTTLILAAVLILRKPVANIFGPNVAYFLWLLPAARLVMPSLSVEKTASVSDTSQLVRDSVIGAVTSRQPGTFVEAIVPQAAFDYGMILLSIWLGGAALLFVVQMARYVAMRDELLSDATELGMTQGIKLIQSDRVAGPLAFGLFRRYIAVPDNFAVLFSSEERELAMQHEIAHHVSGDLIANLIAFIALCLMWFNPLAWVSWRAFRFDQEAACDARVLVGKAPEMRRVYGQALARSAQEGLPTFATALNSPKTIIERLRRLTMKDISKNRRLLGKLGVFAAVGVILPLTATTVTVAAKDGVTVIRTGDNGDQKVKVIKMTRIKGADADSSGDVDAPYVQTITRNGRTIVLRTNYKLSQQEIEKMADEAEASRIEADDAIGEAETARRDAEVARGDAEAARGEAEAARGEAEAKRAEAEAEGMAMASAMASANVDGKYIASMIPDIDISEVTHNCKNGHPVTTDVNGMDGKNKSRVRIVMCGKGMAKMARLSAIDGLKEAISDIKSEEDMPDSVRKQVIANLRDQIRKMERARD
jgi:bla regulator protein blaR1